MACLLYALFSPCASLLCLLKCLTLREYWLALAIASQSNCFSLMEQFLTRTAGTDIRGAMSHVLTQLVQVSRPGHLRIESA